MAKIDSAKLTLSFGHKVLWFLFGAFYVSLFAILASDRFARASAYIDQGPIPVNISLNSISLALAACGVMALYHTAHHHKKVWRRLEWAIYSLMILWIITISLWLMRLLFAR